MLKIFDLKQFDAWVFALEYDELSCGQVKWNTFFDCNYSINREPLRNNAF